ncbi:SusD/RagB family nutrient-binding outer membrane lipoprotein [Catalinimonas sp. 4WD22]|uniref:SusD/RagB family nutrient-binding outer membrane lipoprotein n=1 Tax=Catalinimonas locisalis TaxID=3133978 RepID=UPI003100B584
MMMKRKLYKINLSLLLLIFMQFSCSEDIMDEIDTNPNSPTDVPVSLLLPQATINTVSAIAGGDAARAIAVFVEHATNVRLNPIEPMNVSNNHWNSTYDGLSDLSIIIQKGSEGGDEEGNYTYVGIAKVLYAYTLGSATDLYGDMPHSEALQGSLNRTPAFDSQEAIYTDLQNLLDEAIADLNKEAIANPGNLDLIYQGDTDKWIKAAYALKARFYNRLSNVNPQQSAQNALQAIANSFTGPEESFIFNQYQTGTANANPYANFQKGQNIYAASTTFVDILDEFTEEGFTDPRADYWLLKINDEIVGAPVGNNQSDVAHVLYSSPSLETILSDDAPLPLVTYDELKFIEAEANLRQGNTEEAYNSYEEAVEEALLRTGIAEAEATAYMEQGSVLPGIDDLTLEHIIKQKYISFWLLQAMEAYNDWRRTGIPEMRHPEGTALRLPYPLDEVSRNPNTPSNINDITIFTIPVWWDQNN